MPNGRRRMKRSTLFSTIAIFSGLGIITPLLAAENPAPVRPASGTQTAAAKPAEACMSAVRAFTGEMSKQGYWVGGPISATATRWVATATTAA